MAKETNGKPSFVCSHGKGKVGTDGKCSCRKKNNMCPAGHPCKRMK